MGTETKYRVGLLIEREGRMPVEIWMGPGADLNDPQTFGYDRGVACVFRKEVAFSWVQMLCMIYQGTKYSAVLVERVEVAHA